MPIKKNFKFCLEIAIFKHVFESCRHWPNLLHILVCHSVTSRWNLDYHTPMSILKSTEILWDTDIKNFTVSHSHQIACNHYVTLKCYLEISFRTRGIVSSRSSSQGSRSWGTRRGRCLKDSTNSYSSSESTFPLRREIEYTQYGL